ncbi:unnamed protein product, partial [Darwinula stevensoni]
MAGRRLSALRQLMSEKGLQAYIIPSGDAHQSEYVSDHDKRRGFISNFMGSAGTAVVTETSAMLWTDSRYFLQAQNELDSNWTLMKEGDYLRKPTVLQFSPYSALIGMPSVPTIEVWLSKNIKSKGQVGVDPWLISSATWDIFEAVLRPCGVSLVPTQPNLIDLIWPGEERSASPKNPVFVHELKYSGKSCIEKLEMVAKELSERGASFLVITALDEVACMNTKYEYRVTMDFALQQFQCNFFGSQVDILDRYVSWTRFKFSLHCHLGILNLRGSDIPYNPVFFAYAILKADPLNLQVFMDETKLSEETKGSFPKNVLFFPYELFPDHLQKIAFGGSPIWVSRSSSQAVISAVPFGQRIMDYSPVACLKLAKNPTEIQGMRDCHVRDGAALCSLLAWLEHRLLQNESTSELEVVKHLEKIHRDMDKDGIYKGPSFETIAAYGSHAAIVHYRPTHETDCQISTDNIFLLDCGSHYKTGTTDVTRTVHFGKPTEEQIKRFTEVLRGHIALATVKFPKKTLGVRLDLVARKYLWEEGLDYGHGTGHGVGAFLNVHEGPILISFRANPADPGLQEGMFVTDEPGYYKEGEFGIRIENVMEVKSSKSKGDFNGLGGLCMEPVTWCPIQKKLIHVPSLTNHEVSWINSYHAQCLEALKPFLEIEDPCGYQWLNHKDAVLWVGNSEKLQGSIFSQGKCEGVYHLDIEKNLGEKVFSYTSSHLGFCKADLHPLSCTLALPSGDNDVELFCVKSHCQLSKISPDQEVLETIEIKNPGVACVRIRADSKITAAGCWDGR